MSMEHTNEHLEKWPSLNFNAYVKLTRLSKEDIERIMAQNHKKENKSTLLNERNTPTGLLKQEYIEDTNIEIDDTAIEHNSWQSSVQAFGINVKIESSDVVEVKTEQDDRIRTIPESSTAFSNYMENVNQNEFICKICHDHFDNYEEYIVHKNLIHKNKPFVCKVCNAKFILGAHLNIHLAEHVDYLCMLNSSLSPSEIQSSSTSNLTINPSRNYKNSKSTSEFARRQQALNKKKFKNQNKNSSVKSQKYVFPKIANSNRSHKCKDCNKHFTTRSKLNIHYKQHKQQMICNKCHKKFHCIKEKL